MTSLTPGLLIDPSLLERAGKNEAVHISSGTVRAHTIGSLERFYVPSAIIPKWDWRPLTAAEINVLSVRSPEAAESDIDVNRLPEEITQLASKTFRNVSNASDERSLFSSIDKQDFEELVRQLRTFSRKLGPVCGDVRVRIACPHLLTSTITKNGLRLGLHLDSWFATEASSRPNRLCANLGLESRFLLLINLHIDEIRRLLGTVMSSDRLESLTGTPLGLAFMEAFPHYPVIRLRVDPGYYYRAPTEVMIHDGSTSGMNGTDIAAHIFGVFAAQQQEGPKRLHA